MKQKKNAIEIRNLSKVYKLYNRNLHRLKEILRPGKKYHQPFYALNGLDLDIRKGEILGIVGKNGAGKSTLLKIISGITTPTGGSCKVTGQVSTILGVDIGFNPELTGIENILLDGTLKGYSKNEMSEKMEKIISFAEIGDFIHQPVKSYSSGMKSRLGFATAVHIEPEILILDEILSVGDELFKRKCFAKMEELFDTGCTVLFVSHNALSINEICTRAVFLDEGKLLLEGHPKLVTTYYMKFMFTKPANLKKVKEEIIQLNQDEQKKQQFNNKSDIKEIAHKTEPEVIHSDEKAEDPEEKTFFLEEFKSKSAVEHKNHEVNIRNIQMKTKSGKKVNSIIMNEEYLYSFEVIFDMDVKNVIFGSRFTTVKGFFISGMNSKNSLMKTFNVKKGERFLIEYQFTCTLLPGNYYITVNVSGDINNKRVPLNHITDAYVFKVRNTPPARQRGIVHLNQDIKVEKIDSR